MKLNMQRIPWVAVVLVLAIAPVTAQPIYQQAISEPDVLGSTGRGFSPDGEWACFARKNLFCARANSSTLASINHPPLTVFENVQRVEFLPNSQTLLYTVTAELENRLWLARAGQAQSARDFTPQWPTANIQWWLVSEAGDVVLYVVDDGQRQLYYAPGDDSEAIEEIGSNIAIGSNFFFATMRFSNDAQAVYAWIYERLWRIPLDASPAIPISQLGAQASLEYEEHDGYVYFRAEVVAGRQDLFRTPISGGVPERINLNTSHVSSSQPVFSPDGRYACFFEERSQFELACSDVSAATAQTVGFGPVATTADEELVILSDNQTLYGVCTVCSGSPTLYRAAMDGSESVTPLTGSNVAIGGLYDLAPINRLLFTVVDLNAATRSWQSVRYALYPSGQLPVRR